jgi:hypothetical protein
MKALTLSLLFLLPLPGWGQLLRVDPATHKVTYAEVTEVPGTPRQELYSRARRWFDLQYGYAEEVTLTEREEEGELEIKGDFPLRVGIGGGKVCYTLTLSVKENKYRYLITDFAFLPSTGRRIAFENPHLHPQLRIFARSDERIQLLLASLHQKMLRKETALVEDW